MDTGVLSWALLGHALYLAGVGLIGLSITARRLATLLVP